MTAQDREFITNSLAQIQCINKGVFDINERELCYLSSLLSEEDDTIVAIRGVDRIVTLGNIYDSLIVVSVGLRLLLEEDEKNES